MKKFLEELSKASTYMQNEVPTDTAADRQYQELESKFKSLIGKRALYVSKVNKDSRVVVIEEVTHRYVVVSYKYYGLDYSGKIRTSVTYGAMLCGDDRLDVE